MRRKTEKFNEMDRVCEIVAMGRDIDSSRVFLCGFPNEKKADEFKTYVESVTDYTVFFAEYYGTSSFRKAVDYYDSQGVHVTGFEFFPNKSFYKVDFINSLLKGYTKENTITLPENVEIQLEDRTVILEKGDSIRVLNEKLSKNQVKDLIRDIKSIKFEGAEGTMAEHKAINASPPFKSVFEAEDFIERASTKPDMGYNKINTIITLNDGSKLTGFRYDHGYNDPSFSEQLFWYLENNVSMEED